MTNQTNTRPSGRGAGLLSRITVREALFLAFFISGFFMATWITRTPALREGLGLTLGEMGLVLLGLSAGSMPGLVAATPLVKRCGPRRLIIAGEVLTFVGVVGAGASLLADAFMPGAFVAAFGLALVGFGSAILDVSLNVSGAALERRWGEPVLTSLHGFFSFGEAVGAFFGLGMVALGLEVFTHFSMVAALMAVLFVVMIMKLGDVDALAAEAEGGRGEAAPAGGRLVIDGGLVAAGAVIFAVALCEGTANDWLPILLRESIGASSTFAALAFAVFAACLAGVRFTGAYWLKRFGSIAVLTGSAATALAGLVIVITSSAPALVIAGVVFWAGGAALGFPVALSASAAMTEGDAARRMSILSCAGYLAFLAGPPTLGFVGDHWGLPASLALAAAFLLLPITLARQLRPKAH